MEKEIIFRQFSFGDIDNIVKLLNLVFKPDLPFTEEWWKWKYQSNPAGFYGEQGDIWVATHNDKVVGFYAIIPVKVKIFDKTVIAGQSVDTAVHPNYRRMGIFSTLARKVYSSSVSRYAFLFGYPAEMSFKGFISLGWQQFKINELIKFMNYDRPLNTFL